jgi:LacI family transcriptional regulator
MLTRITLKQLAEKAGVSTATVSRVCNGRELQKVSSAVRERVQQLIHLYGYVPDSNARNLVCGRSGLIGVQMLGLYGSTGEIVEGISEVLSSHGYGILLGISAWQEEQEEEALRMMLRKGVDALLWLPVGAKLDPELKRTVKKAGCPVIAFHKSAGNITCIMDDQKSAGIMAASHLVEIGGNRLAVISPDKERDDHARLRLEGACAVLREKKVEHQVFTVGGWSSEHGYEGASKALTSGKRFTALLCTGDRLAVGAYRACAELNLRVGEDVAICGIGGGEPGTALLPKLTTVVFHPREVGRKTAQAALDALAGKQPASLLIEPKLCLGESARIVCGSGVQPGRARHQTNVG